MRALSSRTYRWVTLGLLANLIGFTSYDWSYAKPTVINRKIAYEASGWEPLLEIARETLTRKPVRKFLRELFKEELREIAENIVAADPSVVIPNTLDVTETQFMMLLREAPDMIDPIKEYLKTIPRTAGEDTAESATDKEARKAWRKRFKELVASGDIRQRFVRLGNPVSALIMNEDLVAGYTDLKMYANHPYKKGDVTIPASNLKQTWIDIVKGAKSQFALNVFDFDLMDVADAIIARTKGRGKLKEIYIGIDKGVIEARPEVKAVFDKIKAAMSAAKNKNYVIEAVDSVGLNHQKLAVADWGSAESARVLMSTGNLTQSCSGPEGDLKDIPAEQRPKESIPNANHVITLQSQMAALVIHHELIKTIVYKLRGGEYPLGGTYRIYGVPTSKKATKGKEYTKPYLQLSFSPNGAFNNINNNVIGSALRETTGPVIMGQFATSSKNVESALFDHATAAIRAGKKFDFKSVGDTPFAMQFWSVFLAMSGMELQGEGDSKRYVEIPNSKWIELMGKEGFEEFRKSIRIAPRIYGTKSVQVGDKSFQVTSKIHIKELVTGDEGARIAIIGSFNFSEGAESNQEYIASFRDAYVAEELTAMILALYNESPRSVAEEAVRRNRFREFDQQVDAKTVEKQGGSCNTHLNSSGTPVTTP
ncbi:MAG: hypothetical protein JNL01_15730 [Bdellovibrionales bacterium]|nr:hypothetical protein [Bdellovibrionales bacterium]